jgi:hypothetical protein
VIQVKRPNQLGAFSGSRADQELRRNQRRCQQQRIVAPFAYRIRPDGTIERIEQ